MKGSALCSCPNMLWQGRAYISIHTRKANEVRGVQMRGYKGEEGRKSIHHWSRAFLNHACFPGYLSLSIQSPFNSALCSKEICQRHFHLYIAKSVPYNFLLVLNPQDTAYKFKEFQASTETSTSTPRTRLGTSVVYKGSDWELPDLLCSLCFNTRGCQEGCLNFMQGCPVPVT